MAPAQDRIDDNRVCPAMRLEGRRGRSRTEQPREVCRPIGCIGTQPLGQERSVTS
jgi:hypothetical protein